MFIVKPLPFVTTFIDALDKAIEESKPGLGSIRHPEGVAVLLYPGDFGHRLSLLG